MGEAAGNSGEQRQKSRLQKKAPASLQLQQLDPPLPSPLHLQLQQQQQQQQQQLVNPSCGSDLATAESRIPIPLLTPVFVLSPNRKDECFKQQQQQQQKLIGES